MKILKHCALWLAFCLLSPAFAGDTASLDFIGFSQDGQYVAFEQYGVVDGQGAAYSELYFVHVPDNKWAAKPLIAQGDEDSGEELSRLRQENRTAADKFFQKFGISGGDQGRHLIAHTLHDLGADLHRVRFTPDYPTGVYRGYEVLLTERPADSDCTGFGKARIFTLTLVNQDSRSQSVLQHDKKLPASRGCAFSYRIQDVYLHSDKSLAVVLNVFAPGFEGRKVRYLVVTGELKP